MDAMDFFEGGESDCCGGRILLGGICADCGEHCEAFEEGDEDKPTPTCKLTHPKATENGPKL